MTELERLRKATRLLQGEVLAFRAVLPWIIGRIAVATDNDPPQAVRELHQMAQRTLDNWIIEGDPETALRLKEAASVGVDNILSSIRLTKLDADDD